jgi:hypothetical protein
VDDGSPGSASLGSDRLNRIGIDRTGQIGFDLGTIYGGVTRCIHDQIWFQIAYGVANR